jgi:hypothetical protein
MLSSGTIATTDRSYSACTMISPMMPPVRHRIAAKSAPIKTATTIVGSPCPKDQLFAQADEQKIVYRFADDPVDRSKLKTQRDVGPQQYDQPTQDDDCAASEREQNAFAIQPQLVPTPSPQTDEQRSRDEINVDCRLHRSVPLRPGDAGPQPDERGNPRQEQNAEFEERGLGEGQPEFHLRRHSQFVTAATTGECFPPTREPRSNHGDHRAEKCAWQLRGVTAMCPDSPAVWKSRAPQGKSPRSTA